MNFIKKTWFLPVLALPLLAWLLAPVPENPNEFSPEKINLALRRTADGLLRAAGDSTSRIPAVEQTGAGIWRVRLEQPFDYEKLPALLQSSLDLHEIKQSYEVAVRRCDDAAIDLGYHQLDFLQNKAANADSTETANVPCGVREMPEGCHFIEITFFEKNEKRSFAALFGGISLLILGGFAGFWFSNRRKKEVVAVPETVTETDFIEIGNSRLDVAGQALFCGNIRQNLTFREAKLLRLFATNLDKLLERDFILQQVWADEGILVGRSVDMFVSRLRKKLAVDPSVGIVAVHGVGYRLETGKTVGN